VVKEEKFCKMSLYMLQEDFGKTSLVLKAIEKLIEKDRYYFQDLLFEYWLGGKISYNIT
jgi:hypothetical protein